MLKRTPYLLIVIVIYTACQVSYAEQGASSFGLWGHVVAADYATKRCAKPDSESQATFNSNLKAISAKASKEVRNAEDLIAYEANLGKQIQEMVDKNGCNYPAIVDLLKTYKSLSSTRF